MSICNEIWVLLEEINFIRGESWEEAGYPAEWRLSIRVGDQTERFFWDDIQPYGTRKRFDREFRVQPMPSGVPLIHIWGVETDMWPNPDDRLPQAQLIFDPSTASSELHKVHGSNSDFEYEVTVRIRSAERAILDECSDFAPSAIVFNGEIYVAWLGRGNDQVNLLNLKTNKKVTLTDTGVGGVGLAAFRGRLYLAWTGTDQDNTLNLIYSANGVDGWQRVTLPWANSFVAPAIASNDDESRLCIAWTGTDEGRHLNAMFSSDGNSFGPVMTVEETSNSGLYLTNNKPSPSSTVMGVMMSWAGTDSRVNTVAVFDGGTTGPKTTVNELTDAPPALLTFLTPNQPAAWYAWRGVEGEGQINIARSIFVGSLDQKRMIGEQSIAGPCLLNLNGQCLYAFWTGTDDQRHLNYKVVESVP